MLSLIMHNHTQHNNIEFCYAECLVFTVIIVVLTVIVLNDSTITLNIEVSSAIMLIIMFYTIMLSVIMLSVIILNYSATHTCRKGSPFLEL